MIHYNWLGNFVMNILSMHKLVSNTKIFQSAKFRIGALYLDPSIGGISGMSLTRFHLRMFPDPVTEGVTFWKSYTQTLQIFISNNWQSILATLKYYLTPTITFLNYWKIRTLLIYPKVWVHPIWSKMRLNVPSWITRFKSTTRWLEMRLSM